MDRLLASLRRGVLDTRLLILLVPAALVLAADLPVLDTLLYSLAAMFMVVAFAHIVRRVLFHYVDLELVEAKASESPTGAGLVFFGICFLLSSFVVGSAIWLAH